MSISSTMTDRFGSLFHYPDKSYLARLETCCIELQAELPAAGRELEKVREELSGRSHWEVEELYTRSFDLNPVCALEIGWHLYGEQYERGRFLAHAREMLVELEVDERRELPDHLSSMMSALGRLQEEDAAPFAARYLLPALLKMTETLRGNDSPFAGLMAAAAEIAKEKSGGLPVQMPDKQSDVVQLGGRKAPKPKWRSAP